MSNIVVDDWTTIFDRITCSVTGPHTIRFFSVGLVKILGLRAAPNTIDSLKQRIVEKCRAVSEHLHVYGKSLAT